MVVCHCQKINSAEIEAAALRINDTSYVAVLRETGACRGCGSCAPQIVKLLATMKPQESEEGTKDAP
jgi:NAD(P)H-nitrite reductase large subunit